MRIMAYTDRRYLRGTLLVVGRDAEVLSSPPWRAQDVSPGMLWGYDVIYIDLHGFQGKDQLYSLEGGAALSGETVRAADLRGTVVVATTCHLPETGLIDAFLDAGATAVVGGAGDNRGAPRGALWLAGAQLLARFTIERLQQGWPVESALVMAKHCVRLSPWRLLGWRAALDALEFRCFRKETNTNA